MNSETLTSSNEEDQPSQDIDLRSLVENHNIAEGLDKDTLEAISTQCSEGFEFDLMTRREWESRLDEWMKLALQSVEKKQYPWPNAANVKYPLLSTAAMQFNARAYPSLVPSTGDVVKTTVAGKDPTGEKLEKANRVSKYMSYQVLHEMDGWEEDMDKLLMMLPILGTAFKKTYYDPIKKQNVSELVLPKNLVVNNWAKDLDSAERISEILQMSSRKVKGKQLSGFYLKDVELGDPTPAFPDQDNNTIYRQDETTPYTIIEQHCFYDIDKDGYPEPYVVTFERTSKKILRIVARFTDENIYLDQDSKLQEICPIQYYTKYGFIPNPDGSFYDIGFGVLLGPLNESVNTLINQLIDSGTLNNLQSGFLGKGLKLKMGEQKFSPGEWKTVQSTADDLKKQILPLPTKEPSNVLFQLMGTLVTSGKELASVAEIFVGKSPGQNTPATTTMATIEQGMKVFTAVYKRIYRALSSEFKKIFDLNRIYLEDEKYVMVLDLPVSKTDFDKDNYDICPGADPNAISQTEKLMKAQGLLEIMGMIPVLDPIKVVSRVLEAQEQPNWQDLFTEEIKQTGQFQPPPDPKMLEMQMKGQMEERKSQAQIAAQQQKMELEARDRQMQMMQKNQEHRMEMQQKQQIGQLQAATEVHKQRIFLAQEQASGQQTLRHNEESHQQQMQQMKQQGDLKSKQSQMKTSSTGAPARSRSKSSGNSKRGK